MVAPFKATSRNLEYPWGPGTPYPTRIRLSVDVYGYRQKPPYVSTAMSYRKTFGITPGYSWGNNTDTDEIRYRAQTIATNIARKRFVGQLGDSSSFGATFLAERKATYGMVENGIVSAWKAARAARKGNLVKAAKELGVAPPVVKTVRTYPIGKRGKRKSMTTRKIVLPTGREIAHNLAGRWLWYSYGVAPLMGDMFNAMDVLQREAPWTRVRGTGKASTDSTRKYWVGITSYTDSHTCQAKCSISADVRVKNPNLWLANQMGLVNPVQVVNEAIPFSFVVDWFSNLSQIIMQMTDFVGLEITDPVTKKSSLQHTVTVGGGQFIRTGRFDLDRTLSIPKAKLVFAPERVEWQRGLNAISLLITVFTGKPPKR